MPELKCPHCGKIFEQERSLEQHVSDKHTARPHEQPKAEQHVHPVKHDDHAHSHGHKVKLKVGRGIIIAVVAIAIIGAGSYFLYTSGILSPSASGGGAQSGGSVLNAPIGALGSTHIHADLALFLNGSEITPFDSSYYVRSQFIHVEAGPGAGYVVHMHATNTPIGFFFRSLGMSLTDQCFIRDNGQQFCNGGDSTLKMFVKHDGGNWEANTQFQNYVFQSHDKILITYGNETQDQIQRQEDAVTDFAKANDGSEMDLGTSSSSQSPSYP